MLAKEGTPMHFSRDQVMKGQWSLALAQAAVCWSVVWHQLVTRKPRG